MAVGIGVLANAAANASSACAHASYKMNPNTTQVQQHMSGTCFNVDIINRAAPARSFEGWYNANVNGPYTRGSRGWVGPLANGVGNLILSGILNNTYLHAQVNSGPQEAELFW